MQYARDIAELDAIMATRPLTDQKRIKYFNLQREMKYIDQNMIIPFDAEKNKKRIKKERIIKWVAGAAGFGVALATPAVGMAAVVAVTLGGPLLGRGLKTISEKIRSKSNAMKYEKQTR